MDLSDEQLEMLIELVEDFMGETEDLNQREWALAQATLDDLQAELERGYE